MKEDDWRRQENPGVRFHPGVFLFMDRACGAALKKGGYHGGKSIGT